jgi:hypothetical protein
MKETLNRIGLCVAVLLVSACTKTLYDGPRRPPSEVALIEAVDSRITQLDGLPTSANSSIEVLPGEHSLGITLNTLTGEGYRFYTNEPYTICLKAEAGKAYLVHIEMKGWSWRPRVRQRSDEVGKQATTVEEMQDVTTECESRVSAAALYGTACASGEAQACFALGELAKEGSGVPQDERRAATLFEAACTGGVAMGCNSLGVLYKKGVGVEKDERRAATLFETACTGKVAQGCFNLGLQQMEGRVVPRDEGRAAKLFEVACTGEVAQGCFNLGVLYKEGRGVPKDAQRAATLFEQACQGGMATACGP